MEKKGFPGPIGRNLIADAEFYYVRNTQGSRICIEKRNGTIVTDYDGFHFIDLHCDASVNNLGGNHPAIMRAIDEQQRTGNIFSESHNAPNRTMVELAKKLIEKSPVPKPARVYMSNSGAEANEAAIKMCRAYRYIKGEYWRKKALYFTNAFHGRTLGILPGTNSKPEVQRDPFMTHCDEENTIYLPYPKAGTNLDPEETYATAIEAVDWMEINRLVIELPCQGEGGIIPADENVVKWLYDFTRRTGIIFIVDDIQCGMGRTGTLLGCDRYKWLEPDILTLGKALGGGIPIGVTICRAELDFAKQGMHSSTFGGGPLASRLGLVLLAEIEQLISDGTVERLRLALSLRLQQIQRKFPKIILETRGVGAMWAHEIVTAELRDAVQKKGEDLVNTECYGLRLLGAGRKAIRFMPPLNINHSLLNYALNLYEKVLSSL
ncbi:MAG: aspartate aminotransferase family protein [bacterium]|nr:aspartate aminotransferase family protein [bacterium]